MSGGMDAVRQAIDLIDIGLQRMELEDFAGAADAWEAAERLIRQLAPGAVTANAAIGASAALARRLAAERLGALH